MTRLWTRRAKLLGTAAVLALGSLPVVAAKAETMNGALSKAYVGNPTLNAQRAQVRVTDENVPIAKSGMRPKVTAQGQTGVTWFDSHGTVAGAAQGHLYPTTVGVGLTQTLYDGERTVNSTRSAESNVFAARETLRNTEQNTLLDGATFYMNVLRDTATVNLNRNNVEVLQEQLRQTQDRFNVGEVTRTDVAQAEAALAGGRAQLSQSEANLKTSIAQYRRVIGDEPKQLAPGRSIESFLPKTLDACVALSLVEHPAINASMHGVDAAELQVKVAEGALYPTLGVQSSLQRSFDGNVRGDATTSAQFTAQLSVPIYEGGQYYAQTRQAKESAGQARLNVDSTRDQVRQNVVASWSNLEAAKAQIDATTAQVQANEIALAGVREEAKVGQRTTLDVLNAQQALLNSRVLLVTAQRDRVVFSYSLLSSIGKLSARTLSLKIAEYDPKVHFQQVKDKWIGLTTPGGQ